MQKVSPFGLFVLIAVAAAGLYVIWDRHAHQGERACREAAAYALRDLEENLGEYALLQAAMDYYGVDDPYELLDRFDVEASMENLKNYGDALTPLDAYGIPREAQEPFLEEIQSIMEHEFKLEAVEFTDKEEDLYYCRALAVHPGMPGLVFVLHYTAYQTPQGYLPYEVSISVKERMEERRQAPPSPHPFAS